MVLTILLSIFKWVTAVSEQRQGNEIKGFNVYESRFLHPKEVQKCKGIEQTAPANTQVSDELISWETSQRRHTVCVNVMA